MVSFSQFTQTSQTQLLYHSYPRLMEDKIQLYMQLVLGLICFMDFMKMPMLLMLSVVLLVWEYIKTMNALDQIVQYQIRNDEMAHINQLSGKGRKRIKQIMLSMHAAVSTKSLEYFGNHVFLELFGNEVYCIAYHCKTCSHRFTMLPWPYL